MSTQYFCDLCKEEVIDEGKFRKVDWSMSIHILEICQDCAKSIWKHGKKKRLEELSKR